MFNRANTTVVALCVAATMACGRGNGDEAELDASGNDADITTAAPILETGCLTASGDRFVLTALEKSDAAGGPQTELYQLIGEDDELRPHVGKAVRISGEAEPARVAEVRETSPASPAGTSGTAQQNQPKVQTESQTRLETRVLRVRSVTPTGDDCLASR